MHRLIKYSLDILHPIRTAEAFEAIDWLAVLPQGTWPPVKWRHFDIILLKSTAIILLVTVIKRVRQENDGQRNVGKVSCIFAYVPTGMKMGMSSAFVLHTTIRPLSHWKLILSTFHTGNKLTKANIDDAYGRRSRRFIRCLKHWPTDQSERSISEISSAKFRKIEHAKFISLESWLFTLEIFLSKGTN